MFAASCFPDTGGHWAETFICWLKDNGIVSGYGDGTYRPENYVTRGEMAVFVNRGYELAEANDDDSLGGMSCTNGQIAKWDVVTSKWMCSDDSDHHHDDIYINEGQEDSVTSGMISDGEVSVNDIQDGAVLSEILDDDGDGSGLDADMLDGMDSGSLPKGSAT